MLAASNIPSTSSVALSEDEMYSAILQTWETQAQPFKVNATFGQNNGKQRAEPPNASPPVTCPNPLFGKPIERNEGQAKNEAPSSVTSSTSPVKRFAGIDEQPNETISTTSAGLMGKEIHTEIRKISETQAQSVSQQPNSVVETPVERNEAPNKQDQDQVVDEKVGPKAPSNPPSVTGTEEEWVIPGNKTDQETGEEEDEIASFLRLWDKYKHRLEEILVQRSLRQRQMAAESTFTQAFTFPKPSDQ